MSMPKFGEMPPPPKPRDFDEIEFIIKDALSMLDIVRRVEVTEFSLNNEVKVVVYFADLSLEFRTFKWAFMPSDKLESMKRDVQAKFRQSLKVLFDEWFDYYPYNIEVVAGLISEDAKTFYGKRTEQFWKWVKDTGRDSINGIIYWYDGFIRSVDLREDPASERAIVSPLTKEFIQEEK